jgi:predicted phosphohydrolase
VLIHAGDWMNSGRTQREARDFAEWWNAQPHVYKIFIGGNHDRYLQADKPLILSFFTDGIYLEDSAVTLDGVKFYGSPWTPEFYDWAFMYPRGDGDKYWSKIPDGVDVLITHGPPMGTLDTSVEFGAALGCKELAERVAELRPRAHIFGHIHGGYGIDGISHNVSICNESYRPVNQPHVIDLP